MTYANGDELDEVTAAVAPESGAAFSSHPRPGIAVRQIVLRDLANDRGPQFEIAQIETDGILRIIGKDTGPQVTERFGTGITRYEWICIVPREMINIIRNAARHPGRVG